MKKLKIRGPRTEHEMNWLPPEGESGVKIGHDEGTLVITVRYFPTDSTEEREKKLIFDDCCSFTYSIFPGCETNCFDFKACEHGVDLYSVTEFTNSEAAEMWNAYYLKSRFPLESRIKHYHVFFLSENKSVYAFAKKFRISD